MTLLKGKAIVVTGAAGSIGRALAVDAARRGASVVVNDLRADAADAVASEIARSGGAAVADHSPVQTWAGAAGLVERCTREFGRLDALVNNAGVFHRSDPWEEAEAEIRAMIDVDVLGVLFCGRHAMAAMVAQGTGGAIVNFSSSAAFGLPIRGTYSAAKGAVTAASFSWAFDLKPHGIRVNVVAPSATSRMRANWWDATRLLGYEGVRPASPSALTTTPRPTDQAPPENIAALVTYLLSDRAADVTGQFFQLHESRLTLISRPRDQYSAGVSADRDEWTVEGIADVVEGIFRPHLHPLVDYMGNSVPPDWAESQKAEAARRA